MRVKYFEKIVQEVNLHSPKNLLYIENIPNLIRYAAPYNLFIIKFQVSKTETSRKIYVYTVTSNDATFFPKMTGSK